MQLVLLAQDFPPIRGGIQTYSWELAQRWSRITPEFQVIAPDAPGAQEFDERHQVRVKRVAASRDLFFFNAARALRDFPGPVVTFHSQWPSALLARLGDPQRRVYVAAHGRELLFKPWPGIAQGLYDSLRQKALRNADGVFAVSRFTARLVEEQGVSPERVHVCPNGTDPNLFKPADREALKSERGLTGSVVFLSVSRLVRRKGVATTLRAFAQMRETEPNCHLVIVGEGPEEQSLKALAQELKLESHLTFTGGVSFETLISWYQTADVFVLPAQSTPPDVEGFGIVYLEASACGAAVIGPNEGGPVDAIVAGETGVLVAPNNIAALTDAMLNLTKDPELRKQMGDAGRKRVEQYLNWDAVAERIWKQMASEPSA